ncbi:MAG: aspartate aminotransferase family protein [Chloroflexi bacterium]|nr:aspartate aminotransferase family protein [Chloroflexota bacterium]
MTHRHPHGNIFYRRMAQDHPLIVRGEGVYLYDQDGTRYLDGSGGAIVANIGHGVQRVAQAIERQTSQVAYIHASMFISEALERYCEELAKICPLPDPKFYLLTSGSEAIEAAIKLARQVQVERGHSERYLTISRWGSYHGVTLGALAVTGKAKMRKLYQPMFVDMPHIPPPYCYRCPFGLAPLECSVQCAIALEEEIIKQGPENVAAFLAEPVGGATLGGIVPPPEYWPIVRDICDRYEVLLIADEVMTGMGRTGAWFAIQHWDVQPDIITIGKGAAGGYFPLGILAARGELVDLIAGGKGEFNHGGTYSHHAVGATAGLATLEYLWENNLVEEVARKGRVLERLLEDKLTNFEWVGDIRGMGLMWGIELVQDKESKSPFDPRLHLSQKIADEAFQNGLIIYPGSGSVDGERGDHFMLGPPFTISDSQMEEMVDILAISLQFVGHASARPLIPTQSR